MSVVNLEKRIAEGHALPTIRRIVTNALAGLDAELDALYTDVGWPSIAPERLFPAGPLHMRFSIRVTP